MCPTVINWVKVSEIVFTAILTGLITGLTIVISYSLGKRQADIIFKKESARRDKEIKEQKQKELIYKQIEILKQLIEFRSLLVGRSVYDSLHPRTDFLDGDEKQEILTTIIVAFGLFQGAENLEVVNALTLLTDATNWYIIVDETKEKIDELIELRVSTLGKIFPVFFNRLVALEKQLIP